MNYLQPVYTLRLTSKHCGLRIAINGCVIDEDRIGEPNSMEYPINHYLKNGDNSFDIYHLNIDTDGDMVAMRDDGELTLELFVRENNSQNKTLLAKTVYDASQLHFVDFDLDFNEKQQFVDSLAKSTPLQRFNLVNNEKVLAEDGLYIIGEYAVKEGANETMHISQVVSLPAPFPLWRFFQADELTFHNDLPEQEWKDTRKYMIDVVYQPLWQALKNDDTKALTELFNGRGKELDIAFYNLEGQDTAEMVRHLRGIINDAEFQSVRKLNFDSCDVAVSFNHKMSWLHNWDRSLSSQIEFKHNELDMIKSIPVMFARFDGKWEIVR